MLHSLQRALTHTAYLVGQIVYAAKQVRGTGWANLSIPRGRSRAYLEAKLAEARRRSGG